MSSTRRRVRVQTSFRGQYDFEQDPKAFYDMCKLLKTNKTDLTIDCSKNNATPRGCKVVAPAMLLNTRASEFNMSENRCESEGVIALVACLKFNFSLHTLILRDNQIGPEGAAAISDFLRCNTPLTHLDLYHNMIGNEGFDLISQALRDNTVLEHLNLFWNKADDDGFAAMAQALQYNNSLSYLNMAHNASGHSGFTMLAYSLQDNMTLESIILSDNSAGVRGFAAFGELLASTKTLKVLHLSRNLAGATGLIHLCNGLLSNNSLTALTICGNQGGFRASSALAAAIRSNQTITAIDASFNSFGNQGLCEIAAALRMNKSLNVLNLASNQAGDEGLSKLADSLYWNFGLEFLDLRGNTGSRNVVKSVYDAHIASLSLHRICIETIEDDYLLDSKQFISGTVTPATAGHELGRTLSLSIGHGPSIAFPLPSNDIQNPRITSPRGHLNRLASSSLTAAGIRLIRATSLAKEKDFLVEQLDSEEAYLASLSSKQAKTMLGAQVIASDIQFNNVCKKLVLTNNALKFDGCELILRSLACNRVLEILILDLNGVDRAGLGLVLCDVLEANSTLRFVNLNRNNVDSSEVRSIVSLLKQRKECDFILDIFFSDYETQRMLQCIRSSPALPCVNVQSPTCYPPNPFFLIYSQLILLLLLVFFYPLFAPFLWLGNIVIGLKKWPVAFFDLHSFIHIDEMNFKFMSSFSKTTLVVVLIASLFVLFFPFLIVFSWHDSGMDKLTAFFGIGIIVFFLFVLSIISLLAIFKDPSLRFVTFPSGNHRLFKSSKVNFLDVITYITEIFHIFQIIGLCILDKSWMFPSEFDAPDFFKHFLLFVDFDSKFIALLVLIMLSIWFSGYLHLSAIFSRADLLDKIPFLDLIVRFSSSTFFITIVSNLLRWSDCSYSSGLSILDDSEMLCWEGSHSSYASVSLFLLTIYFISSVFVYPFYQDSYSNGAHIHFSIFFRISEYLFLFCICLVAIFFSTHTLISLIVIIIVLLLWLILTMISYPSDSPTGFALKLSIPSFGLVTTIFLLISYFFENIDNKIFFALVSVYGVLLIALVAYIFILEMKLDKVSIDEIDDGDEFADFFKPDNNFHLASLKKFKNPILEEKEY